MRKLGRVITVRNNRGSTLVIAVLFAAFLTSVIAAVCKVVNDNKASRAQAKVLDSRSLVLKLAMRNARVATYYYNTITRPAPDLDPVFKDCMVGDGTTPLCYEGGPHPLSLIDDSATGIPIIGGSSSNPVYYDLYGRVCSIPDSTSCVFEVWATYNVTCPRSGSPCLQAATIDVTVFLRINSFFTTNSNRPFSDVSASQVVSISNFFDFFDPAFPPIARVTSAPNNPSWGAPTSGSAGPGGRFRNYIAPFSSTGLCIESYSCSGSCTCVYSGASATSGGTPTGPPPPVVSSCPAGTQSINGQCTSFHF